MNVVWPIAAWYPGPLALWTYYKIGRRPTEKPLWQSVLVAATHSGSGCTLGDLLVEGFVVAVPITFLWQKLFAHGCGIVFQYSSIKPVRELSPRQALVAALAIFVIFQHDFAKTDTQFWFMMQIAMLAGLVTAFPVNWWLLQTGLKEKM